jgi:transcriptional regulator with XRE-family HTH domain
VSDENIGGEAEDVTIGERLRRERIRAGLSQPKIADALGVSTAFVWMVEHGQRKPSRAVIERWAAATHAGFADLVIDGPPLFDVTFDVRVPDPFAARRVLEALPVEVRCLASVWPVIGDDALRVRARASALGCVVALVGADVAGIGMMPAPTVQPVRESDGLIAWITARTEQAAVEEVGRRLALAKTTGDVSVERWGRVFVARVGGLAGAGSMRLQELVDGSPIGLFVPEYA